MRGRGGRPPPDPAFVLRGHDTILHAIAFCRSDGGLLAAAGDDGLVRVWDLETRRPALEFAASPGAVLTVKSLRDTRLLTQGKDGVYRVWDLSRPGTGGCEEGAPSPSSSVCAELSSDLHSFCKCTLVPWTRDGSLHEGVESEVIAVPHGSYDVGLWDIRTPQVQTVLSLGAQGVGVADGGGLRSSSSSGMLTALAAHAGHGLGGLSGPLVMGGYEDGLVRVWDVRSSRVLLRHPVNADAVFAVCAACTRQHLVIASGGVGGSVCISHLSVDTAEGAEDVGAGAWSGWGLGMREAASFKFKRSGQQKEGVNQIAARADSKIIAAACWDGLVRVFALKNPRPLAALKCHTKGVQSVAFSADSRWLASASDDTRIALWSIFQDDQHA